MGDKMIAREIEERIKRLETKVFGKELEPANCEGCGKLLAYYIGKTNRVKRGTETEVFVETGRATNRKNAVAMWCKKCEKRDL